MTGRHSCRQEGKKHSWDDGECNFFMEQKTAHQQISVPSCETLDRAKAKKDSQRERERNIFSEPKRGGNPSASLTEKQISLPRGRRVLCESVTPQIT